MSGPREEQCSPASHGYCTGSVLIGTGHSNTLRHSVTSFAEKAGWQEEQPNHKLNRLSGAFHGLQSDQADLGNMQPSL